MQPAQVEYVVATLSAIRSRLRGQFVWCFPHLSRKRSTMALAHTQVKWGLRHYSSPDLSYTTLNSSRHAIPARRAQRQRQRPCAVSSRSGPPNQPGRRRAEGSSTELGAASTSVDEPTIVSSTNEAAPQVNGSMGASLLASIDDAYAGVTASVHDAEVALETSWQQSLPGRWWKSYAQALQTNPVRTKAVTSFVGFVLGDIMAQKIGGEKGPPLRCPFGPVQRTAFACMQDEAACTAIRSHDLPCPSCTLC